MSMMGYGRPTVGSMVWKDRRSRALFWPGVLLFTSSRTERSPKKMIGTKISIRIMPMFAGRLSLTKMFFWSMAVIWLAK